MPALLILIPLLAILALNLPWKSLMNRLAFWVGLALCLVQTGLALQPQSRFWHSPSLWLGNLLLFEPSVDHLSLVMFLAIGIVGAVTLFVCRYSTACAGNRFMVINVLILALTGMNGVVLANDLFSLYVFLEITAVASYILIAFEKGRDAFEGAFKYLILSAVATVMILAALALLMLTAGDLSFAAIQAAIASSPHSRVVLAAIALLMVGLFIKGGLVPFHGWLPDAYSAAPAAASVLLAGIVTKTTGIYTLIRLVTSVIGYNDTLQTLLLFVGAASMLIGALAALGQSDFKRMLAYSSISQVGYMVLGLGAGTVLGMVGAIFHLFNHAIFKSLLFVNAAAVEQQSGTRDMNRMGGLAEKMPVTGWTSVVAFLSTAGIPPLAGFWSKLIIIVALWEAGYTTYAALAVLASLLTLAYFLSMQRRVFFGKLAAGFESLKEGNLWILVPACVLALITIGIGVGIPWLFETFMLPIRSLL
ncbi:MAG: NADH-quinone oxidoreductase subunit L [Verrucomicrobia bacterium]|nr:NADH-quinone oxidoreductase subunit L [Verrucomicrobiota bacterium]MCG2680507.1 NADH-quinone oxidoreductase subunit L [Kiritimatiellia bacterium]MBU4248230.1 NADH-quinone oxidoreductase subunit L [Verrucomicrobiota bacterium]MBU4290433.1 NADH-quinone oxidoreductase subunit L [Verrucomicrobiota bacterium]MBU4430160.1 NADH-quinone oxidoreductase subunit L [Verrucomicrobiota bacterium]